MNSVLFDLGFIEIRWYSICVLLGMITACILIYKEAVKKGCSKDDIENLIFYGLIIGILGARLYYVIFNWSYYFQNPIEIIQMWNGGLAIHGGIISGALFIYFYTKKKKINFLLLLDILVIGLIIGQAIGRWGNFFNGEAYGREVSLEFLKNLHLPQFIIKGMHINGTYYEPTFLYESIGCIIGFIILLLLRRIKGLKVSQLSGFYFVWYGIIRFIIEGFRSDSLMLGSLKMAQMISILFCILGIYLLLRNRKKKNYYEKENLINN